jgi:hypothetical protein
MEYPTEMVCLLFSVLLIRPLHVFFKAFYYGH